MLPLLRIIFSILKSIFEKIITHLLHFARHNLFIKNTGIQSKYMLTFLGGSYTSQILLHKFRYNTNFMKVAYVKQLYILQTKLYSELIY